AGSIGLVLMWKYHTLGLASWLANPLLAAAWVCYAIDRSRTAALLSGAALTLILCFLSIDQVPFGPKGADVPVIDYGAGYWLWLASAAIILVGSSTELFFVHHS